MSIRFKLKVMLAIRGLNQRQISELTGIRPPTISAICCNHIKELPVGVLDKLCEALDCQPADLIEYIPDEEL